MKFLKQRKAELKACVMSALLDKGVFSALETLPTEAAESVVDAAGGSSSQVPVSDRGHSSDCGWRVGRSIFFNA